jgi:L-asparaginase II
MRARPELIRGERAADRMLMRVLPGWVAKGGAEGLMCAAGGGIGVALKAEDGAARALRPALAAFLGRLGHGLPEAFRVVSVENSRGEQVGDIVAEA